jgi:cobalt-zinc-cadmium efflux system outer membrane protein
LQETAKVYDEEISSLQLIVKVFEQQKSKDYVSEADLVRVQAQLYSLQSEYQNLVDNLNDQESQLRLLLQFAPNLYIKPLVNAEGLKAADPLAYGLKSLMDSAYMNRPDLKIAKANLVLSQQNYNYQKALAIPDITLGVNYDKLGSYVPNANAINLGFDIPIFNRNQGNIKSAKIMIDYNDAQLQATQKSLEEQIMRGVQKAVDADKLYKGIDPSFAIHFNQLAKGMVDNYMKRNVNLLTFLNFYDSYKQNIVQLNSILYNKVNSLESINCYTGTNFFNN